MNEKPEILKNFIVLEGLDGSGTTTQLKLLGEKMQGDGKNVFLTCEPSPLSTGVLLRKVLKQEIIVEPKTFAMLFSADRYEHLYNKSDGIIKHLNDGDIVVSDRYLFSSLAYQSLGCGFDFVQSVNKYPLPEFLVYVDLHPEICQQRMGSRGGVEELFDNLSIQDKIIANYEKGMASYSETDMKIIRVDGRLSPEEICTEITEAISR